MIAAADADSDRPIRFGREGAIAPLTLNRPNAANAIDMVLAKALMEASIVCDNDLLAAEAGSILIQLANSATRALGRTRNLLLSSLSVGLEDQPKREARAIAEAGRDPEGRERVAALLTKRKPDFKGNTHG